MYVFPIISVSKYLGYTGSMALAAFATLAYAILNYVVDFNERLDLRTFLLRSLFFLATGLLAGNLARAKQKEEIRLIKDFEEINDQILSDVTTRKAFKLILRRAIETTKSDMGHIRVFDHLGRTNDLKVVTAIGHPENYNWDLRPLDDSLSRKVSISKKPLIISSIRKRHLIPFLGTYFRLHRPKPLSVLFVPLIIRDDVIGVLAVYSRRRFHYDMNAAMRLSGLSPLVEVALKTAEFNRKLRVAADEKKRRLDLLYEIGGQLRAELPLNDLFRKVVALIYEHLDSEEAALFIPEAPNDIQIRKVAVKGPTEKITRTLETIELTYARGESLAGKIFETREHIFLNEVDSRVEYVSEYVNVLPSKRILHYIGVPLIIGQEILGVIRVINKKAPGYSADRPVLSDKGFDESEDVGLIKTIAIQVAAAIKNAKLLKTEKLAAIGKLAQTTGHEIKTNLGTVLNYVDGLKYMCEPTKDVELLGIYTDIQDALWAARNQLQNILMAAKPKVAEKLPIQFEDLLYEFKEKLKREAASTQIEFSVEYAANSRVFLADVDQIRQVLSNLFDNSVYAIQQKMSCDPGFLNGQISMSVHFNLDKLQIRWKDNGTGISKDNLSNVFTPFFTNKDSGNGLGLFISKTIVENHNGTIAVSSEEDEGSMFVIELPILRNGELE